ncbi:recombinase family protein [Flavobacterium rakeshii]|uniref:recombinase family protein n=1 Tax=Flavobacterium rakeshii TaxID=1038845 RepID=UPI002E7AEC24|nr:recombinase family protein [Flavobacterium rakeshii]MEE1897441.1 recombinase family protein [Flavobacterium rakeshii]
MKNVVIYTRVSTDEQAEKGFSLRHQKEVLTTYTKINNLKIMNHFEEDYSAKNFKRPEWSKLINYVKKNKKSIDKILFTKWDRFSRNIEEALTVIRVLNNMGIEVNSVEQPLDLSNPDNKVMLAMYLIIPEVENDKISQRTKDGMRRAMKEGCYLAKAPYGYSNLKIDGKTSIAPNDDAKLVQKAFVEVAKGFEAVEVIRKKLREQSGLKLEKQQFYNMLRNLTYCGKIVIPEYKKEPAQVIIGIHEAIITPELFNSVQEVINGRKKKGAKLPSTINVNFPIKKNLVCPKCGKQITGSRSKGNGGYYEYYHCTSKCKVRLKKQTVHNNLISLLNDSSLNSNIIELYKEILTELINRNETNINNQLKSLSDELKKNNELLSKAEDKRISDEITQDAYMRATTRYMDKINELENEMSILQENEKDLKKYVDDAVSLLCRLGIAFEQTKDYDKGSFLNVIYPENLILENDCFRTKNQNEVLELMTRVFKGSEQAKIKKATKNSGFSNVAPPLGLEPRTL